MSTEVSNPNETSIAVPTRRHAIEEAAAGLGSNDWLPRLQCMGSNSTPVKEKKAALGVMAIIDQDLVIDLGEEVDVYLCSFRPKALDMSGDSIVVCYDPEHEEWDRIRTASLGTDSSCVYGNEFLVYVPSVERFATFHMSSKTTRNESKNVLRYMPEGELGCCTLWVKLIDPPKSKFSWHSPLAKDCVTALIPPNRDELLAAIEKFEDHPVVEGLTEKTEEAEDAQER